MSLSPLETVWAAICDELKKSISDVTFNCFFKDLVPVFMSDGEFTISINDQHIKGLIENNYSEKLNAAIKTIIGLDMVARIVVDEDEEVILKAEQQSEGLSFEDFFTAVPTERSDEVKAGESHEKPAENRIQCPHSVL